MSTSNITTVEIKLLVKVDTENSELCPTGDAVTSNCILNTIENDFFLDPVEVLEVREVSDE